MNPRRSLNWHLAWPDEGDSYPSGLVKKINVALRKPIADLNLDEVRILLGQNFGLDYVVPIALATLREDPLYDATYYPGDLLAACIEINPSFWKENSDLHEEMANIAKCVQSDDSKLNTIIQRFLSLPIQSSQQKTHKKR